MISKSTILALGGLLLCSACADGLTTRASMAGNDNLQMSSARWDDMTSPTQSAKVINGSLIFMR
jgi:hypothetical protein